MRACRRNADRQWRADSLGKEFRVPCEKMEDRAIHVNDVNGDRRSGDTFGRLHDQRRQMLRKALLQEDGCFEYRFSFAIDDPNVVLIFEEWRDQEALTAHFGAPHMAVFQQAIAGFVTGAPSVSRYEVTTKGPLR